MTPTVGALSQSVRARLLPCTAFAFLLVAFSAAPVVAQSAGSGQGGGCLFGICDAGTWLQDIVGRITSGFLGGLIEGIGGAVTAFPDDTNFIIHTPAALSYRNDQVQQFQSASRLVANGLLAVVALVGGFNVMVRPYLGSTYHSAMELVPRLLLGVILINGASFWGRLAIDVNNALCGAFGGGPPPTINDTVWRSMAPAGLLVVLIYVVMGLLLVLQQLMRLALVDVLLATAPLAAICWILPQTHGWARLWGSLFVGTVFAQFVQVLALRLGFNLATGFPPGTAAGLIQPLLGIAVLALVLKIPGLMRGGAAGGNFVGSLVGTAVGAAVGSGASRLVGVGLAGHSARGGDAATAVRPANSSSQLSLPIAVGVGTSEAPRNGQAAQQMTLPVSVAYPVRGGA
jgi:Conjugal transfer protein TrbL